MHIFAIGVLFALGLGVSGMTLPTKVIGFLDLAGDWDPSLAFVMIGAIGVYSAAFRFIVQRNKPVYGERFRVPTRRDITPRLVGGATVFGVGWGLAGICPGPGIVTAVTGATPSIVFMVGLLGGMLAWKAVDGALSARRAAFEADVVVPSTP